MSTIDDESKVPQSDRDWKAPQTGAPPTEKRTAADYLEEDLDSSRQSLDRVQEVQAALATLESSLAKLRADETFHPDLAMDGTVYPDLAKIVERSKVMVDKRVDDHRRIVEEFARRLGSEKK